MNRDSLDLLDRATRLLALTDLDPELRSGLESVVGRLMEGCLHDLGLIDLSGRTSDGESR